MAVKILGRLFQVGIAKETVRGTPVAAASFWIPFSDMAINEKFENAIDEQSLGVIEDTAGQTRVKEWAEGTFKAPVGDAHFPLILLSVLGSLSTAANPDLSALVKDHTITVGQSAQHQSLTLFLDDPAGAAGAQDYKHALAVVSSLEIAYEQTKFLEYTATVKALKGVQAALTPAYVAENRFLPQHVIFKMAANLAGLGAAAATVVKSLTLKIDQTTEEQTVLGNKAPVDFLNKQFVIEGTVEALWDDEATFKAAALAGTVKAMRIDIKNTDVVIGTAANPQITIDLAKVVFKEVTRAVKLNDMVAQTLQFKAHYSASDSKMVTIKCTNLQTSY